jgi:hypothetical protein
MRTHHCRLKGPLGKMSRLLHQHINHVSAVEAGNVLLIVTRMRIPAHRYGHVR